MRQFLKERLPLAEFSEHLRKPLAETYQPAFPHSAV